MECLHRSVVLKAFINELDFLCNNKKSHEGKKFTSAIKTKTLVRVYISKFPERKL